MQVGGGGTLLSTGLGVEVSTQELFLKTPIKFARYRIGNKITYGLVERDRIREIKGSPFTTYRETGLVQNLSDVTLQIPCEPTNVLTIGQSYPSRIQNMPIGSDTFFTAPLSKTPDSLLEHEGTSHLPSDSEDVHYEGEIVVVTGKQAENVAPEGAHEYILGVTCGNNITARDWQTDALRMKDAKVCDTIGPFGPYIATGIIYGALLLKTRLNGKVMQEEQSRNLILDIPTLVSFANKQVTLMPQDVIYTGTPGKTGALKNGDVVEVEIDQVGVLRNTVRPTLVPSRS